MARVPLPFSPEPQQSLAMGFALLPYIVVALAHLVSKALRDDVDIAATIDDGTRPLLLPALIVAVLSSAPKPVSTTTRWLLAALCCSWIGDLTLRWFLVGLGAFLCAHLCFLVTMTKTWAPPSLRPVGGLAVVWWIGLLAVLHEQLGALLVPVGLYGAVLGAMAVVASRGGAVAFVGAVCFVASDSLLAFRLFTPWASSRAADVVTMGLYCLAQGLLVLTLQRSTRASPTT